MQVIAVPPGRQLGLAAGPRSSIYSVRMCTSHLSASGQKHVDQSQRLDITISSVLFSLARTRARGHHWEDLLLAQDAIFLCCGQVNGVPGPMARPT